jgi:hypothetical protein
MRQCADLIHNLCNTAKGSRSLRSWLLRLETAGDPRAAIVRALASTDQKTSRRRLALAP